MMAWCETARHQLASRRPWPAAPAPTRHPIKIDNGTVSGGLRSARRATGDQAPACCRRNKNRWNFRRLGPWATWAGVRHRWLRASHGTHAGDGSAKRPPTVAYGARRLRTPATASHSTSAAAHSALCMYRHLAKVRRQHDT